MIYEASDGNYRQSSIAIQRGHINGAPIADGWPVGRDSITKTAHISKTIPTAGGMGGPTDRPTDCYVILIHLLS